MHGAPLRNEKGAGDRPYPNLRNDNGWERDGSGGREDSGGRTNNDEGEDGDGGREDGGGGREDGDGEREDGDGGKEDGDPSRGTKDGGERTGGGSGGCGPYRSSKSSMSIEAEKATSGTSGGVDRSNGSMALLGIGAGHCDQVSSSALAVELAPL
jgi:hypothetical protein